jgi:hypothetical protein
MTKSFIPALIEIKESDGSFKLNLKEFPTLLELLFGFSCLMCLWSFITTGKFY